MERKEYSCSSIDGDMTLGLVEELSSDPALTAESIAERERCSVRQVNKTLTLAFLAPDLVKAAIEGRLPGGMGLARLCDLPAAWSRQHEMLGLTCPFRKLSSGLDSRHQLNIALRRARPQPRIVW